MSPSRKGAYNAISFVALLSFYLSEISFRDSQCHKQRTFRRGSALVPSLSLLEEVIRPLQSANFKSIKFSV